MAHRIGHISAVLGPRFDPSNIGQCRSQLWLRSDLYLLLEFHVQDSQKGKKNYSDMGPAPETSLMVRTKLQVLTRALQMVIGCRDAGRL